MLDNHLENELEGKSERGTNIRFIAVPCHRYKQKRGFSLASSSCYAVQWVISAAPLSRSDCTQGAKTIP